VVIVEGRAGLGESFLVLIGRREAMHRPAAVLSGGGKSCSVAARLEWGQAKMGAA
jgi:hypothetical protein